jgi:SAM-dependent methyltransferase
MKLPQFILRPIRRRRRVLRRRRLLAQLPKHGVGAEIGVWKGDFSAEIIRICRPRKLHLIDPWEYQSDSEYSGALYGDAVAKEQAHMEATLNGIRSRFAYELNAGTVEINREFSQVLAPTFPDEYFDWVYVDGNHLYEFVKQDLESFYPKLRPGGFLAGDDYHDRGWWKGGVKQAVDEFAESHACELTIVVDQFVIRKP